MDGKKRHLAMFNRDRQQVRRCDIEHIKVEDVAPRGLTADQACVRRRKTGHPVKLELTEQTREAVDAYQDQAEALRRLPNRVGAEGHWWKVQDKLPRASDPFNSALLALTARQQCTHSVRVLLAPHCVVDEEVVQVDEHPKHDDKGVRTELGRIVGHHAIQ